MWWGSQPKHCLKIGTEELVWAQMGRGWTGKRHDRCTLRRVEPGAIRVSPIEPNLVRVAEIQEQVRALVGPSQRARLFGTRSSVSIPLPIVLLLPDVCLRTAVFELDRLPRRGEEREALVRWRFGQDHLFPLTGAKVVYQAWPSGGREEQAKRNTILAAAIHEAVLEQYEALCAACHLVPVQITTAGLQLCNLWLDSQPNPPTGALEPDVLWVSLLDRTFSALAFQQGRLVFTRTKLLGAGEAEGLSGGNGAEAVAREVGTSLRVWQDTGQAAREPRLVLAVPSDEPEMLRALEEETRMPVERLDWDLFRQLGWTKRMQQVPLSAMPAVAGLC